MHARFEIPVAATGGHIGQVERGRTAPAHVLGGFEQRLDGAQLRAVEALLESAEDVRRGGSAALDLAYVAAGRSDGYFEAGVHPWDIAAGVLMVREAGGRISDFKGASTGPMNVAPAGGRQIVAANVRLIEPLQKTLVDSGYVKEFQ